MKCARIRTATLGAAIALASAATPAVASWQWVDDGEPAGTTVYEESRDPGYYQQQPRTYVRETETYQAPVVTDRETFRDGPCDVTRTYLSDGTSTDDRVCSEYRLVPPHVFIIDRIGRHFDRLRGYDRY